MPLAIAVEFQRPRIVTVIALISLNYGSHAHCKCEWRE